MLTSMHSVKGVKTVKSVESVKSVKSVKYPRHEVSTHFTYSTHFTHFTHFRAWTNSTLPFLKQNKKSGAGVNMQKPPFWPFFDLKDRTVCPSLAFGYLLGVFPVT